MGWSSCNSPPLSPSPERPNVDIRAPILQSDEPSAANKLENDEAENEEAHTFDMAQAVWKNQIQALKDNVEAGA